MGQFFLSGSKFRFGNATLLASGETIENRQLDSERSAILRFISAEV